MRTKTEQLNFLVDCLNAVRRLLQKAGNERYLSADQRALMKRWRAVSRGINLDISQLLHSMPPGTQLELSCFGDEDGGTYIWTVSQQIKFWRLQDKNPLNEGVEADSTRQRDGS